MSSVAAQPGPRFRLLGSGGAFVKYGLDVQEDALRAGLDPRVAGWGAEPPAMWGRLGIGDDTRTSPRCRATIRLSTARSRPPFAMVALLRSTRGMRWLRSRVIEAAQQSVRSSAVVFLTR